MNFASAQDLTRLLFGTYMDRHLDAWLCTGTLEDDIKAVRHVEGAQSSHDILLCPSQLIVSCFRLVNHRQAVCLLRKALLDSKVQASLVDVNGAYSRCARSFGKGAGKETYGTDTKHKNG